ncbi:hypothetical protein AB0M38_30665 [Streptomyces sp. NPDC051742]|uniref:hypothetical protein n=1 Tax=unclassified Streptomyces TaxID=2593676 RepID=UPI003439C79E
MTNEPRNPVSPSVTTMMLVGVAAAMWAAWLGWDQHRDVHPDGSSTGPYEAWQVIGLGLGLLIPVCWSAFRGHVVAAVLGTSGGLTLAAAYDWSDDASGLFVIGVGMVMIGSAAATSLAAFLTSVLHKGMAGPGSPGR